MQEAGPYGESLAGGALYVACLMRSAVASSFSNSHLLPCPRGSLSNLKQVVWDRATPRPGEIKVGDLIP